MHSGASVHDVLSLKTEKLYENLFLWSETNKYVNTNAYSYASSI